MMKKILFSMTTIALSSAFAASSYHVTLFDQSTIAGKTLKAGEYKLEVNPKNVVLKQNKEVTEVPARVEIAPKKFNSTSVRYGDNHEIKEISIGGTNKKVVIGPASAVMPTTVPKSS